MLTEGVLHGGWTMPAMPRDYGRSGGLLGQNSTKVHLVQSVLLGLTAVAVYLGFGRRLSPGAGLVHLDTTA